MLYVIVIAVVLLIILLVYVGRKVAEKQRNYKANHSTDLPRTTQDLNQQHPVTFRGTANEVTDRVFGPGRRQYDQDGEEYVPFNRRSMSRGVGVERAEDDAERDMDLPRYGDTRNTTAVRAPERAYNPQQPPRTDSYQGGNASNGETAPTTTQRDAPPVYERAISIPAVTAAPPVVSAA